MKNNIIRFIVAVCLLVILLVIRGLYFDHNSQAQLIAIDIASGTSVAQIAGQLQDKGVIKSTFWFKVYLKLYGQADQIKAGSYSLPGNLTNSEVIKEIISGKAQVSFDLTIPEGFDLYDIAALLQKKGVVASGNEFFKVVGYPAKTSNSNFAELKAKYPLLQIVPNGNSLEGMLFPDTYRYYRNANLEDVLKKIFVNAENKFEEEIKDKLPGKNMKPYEIYTLASIVAKEGKTLEDKKMIAGVFYNRLNSGMALQSDPTVNYVTGKVTDNPSLNDINVKSPYNTYKNTGLPPSPISNPGLDDLLAVLEPAKHNYYYFLNTTDGKIIYSRTFEEHKANRQKYGQ